MPRSIVRSALMAAVATAATATSVGVLAAPGSVAGADEHGGRAPVFVQTNDPTGNEIVSYLPGDGGRLHQFGRFKTGGLGIVIPGAQVDALASQGGLAFNPANGQVVAVNAGSNTLTVFQSDGPLLGSRTVLPSGGSTPVSVAVRGNRVYVLNAGGTGEVQGFFASSLEPIPGSAQSLGLTPGLVPPYLNTPGQIGFTPDGRHLVVTTKANGSNIDVLNIGPGGVLSSPVDTPSATPVPFGFTFDPAGDLVVSEAKNSALTTYRINPNSTVTERASTTNGQSALCWVTGAGPFFYGANAGSNTLSGYTIDGSGTPTVVDTTTTDPGPIDMATSPDGRTLYVEAGGSDVVDSFLVRDSGALVFEGSVTTMPPGHVGLEGIAVGH